MSTNIVLLVGNLGNDPETRGESNEPAIANLSLGTSRLARNRDGKTYKDAKGFTAKETEWHRITCFNGLAKTVAQYAKKGMLVSIQGRIHYSQFEKDGVTRYATEIIAEDVQFLTRAKGQSGRDADGEIG